MNILLIENDASHRLLIKVRLREAKAKTRIGVVHFQSASSLKEAYDILEFFEPDLIIMDLGLDDAPSYIYVVPYIKTFADRAPVIVLSGSVNDPTVHKEIEKSPAKAYLDKREIMSEKLIDCVVKVLKEAKKI